MRLLDSFRKRAPTDFDIDLPDTRIVVNHSLKLVFLYALDSNLPDDAYAELEKHLNKQHYFLQIVIAARGMPMPQE